MSLSEGTIVKTLKFTLGSAEFGEVDHTFFYADKTDNKFKLMGITAPPTNNTNTKYPGCKKFSLATARCFECDPAPWSLNETSHNCTQNATTTPPTNSTANGNNIPGVDLTKLEFLDSSHYTIDIGSIEVNRALITFKQFGEANPFEKEAYIKGMVENYP